MKMPWAAPFLSLVLAFTTTSHALPVRPDTVLRGNSRLQPDGIAMNLGSANRSQNMTQADSDVVTTGFLSPAETAKWWLKDNDPPAVLNTSSFAAVNATSSLQALYSWCTVAPQACTVNQQQISKDLLGHIVLILGCSLDIYALNYFCKAANAPVIGYTRNPGNEVYEPGNFAYCNMGGLILAYSFHPGSSGPPYFEACDKVLHGPCSGTRTEYLVQQSVTKVFTTFGKAPSAIVVDSSLWDAANWWAQDGKPPEPYLVPAARLTYWCTKEFPSLINAVHAISPTSRLAFRTAPRVEPAFGYGHSMHNIDAMNNCYRISSLSSLAAYHLVDYNMLVEMFLQSQGIPGQPKEFYEDPFHPGVIPSVLYIDWVLQWVTHTNPPLASR